MSDREEIRIIEDVRRGNRHVYAQLVDRYKNPIFNLAYRMTGNYEDAEDLAQETFVTAYVRLAGFDSNRKFFSWLYTIALNLIRNHLKKKSRIVAADSLGHSFGTAAEGDGKIDDPEHLFMDGQDIDRLNASMLQLSEDLREALILRFQQGLSFDDIAEVAGISAGAAKMRVYRALERLRDLLEEKKKRD